MKAWIYPRGNVIQVLDPLEKIILKNMCVDFGEESL